MLKYLLLIFNLNSGLSAVILKWYLETSKGFWSAPFYTTDNGRRSTDIEHSSCWGLYAQHVRWELDLNSFIRTILSAGSTVPAFFGILKVRGFVILRCLHVNRVCRADGIAKTAAGTLFHVKNGGHLLSSNQTCSWLELSGETWRSHASAWSTLFSS